MTPVLAALAYARASRRSTLHRIADLVRIPSISADPRRAGDVARCATRLAGWLNRTGLDTVRVLPTARHPVVYGEWCRRPNRPTVLVYGHYDVQPVDPVPAWTSPPFCPTRRGDFLHGRGASDDKGQLAAHLAAIEAWLRGPGLLPVNVRCLFDGEEEIGSPHLTAALHRLGPLSADVVIISDTRMLGPGRPAVVTGLRGVLNLEVEVRGPAHDLHSGAFGGAVHNPAQALCELLAGLHDDTGRVTVPGFYRRVRHWGPVPRRRWAASAPADATVLRRARVRRGWGEPGWSLHERTTLRPAITVSGITAGYQGQGAKSIIPAVARAKIGVRLVVAQDPAEVQHLLCRHLRASTPATVRTTLRAGHRVPPAIFDPANAGVRAVSRACRRTFGVPPVLMMSGGTIPAAGILARHLAVPVVLLGFALPDDNAHAPNERLHLPTLWTAIDTAIWTLAELGDRMDPVRGGTHHAWPSAGACSAPRRSSSSITPAAAC